MHVRGRCGESLVSGHLPLLSRGAVAKRKLRPAGGAGLTVRVV